MGKLTVTMSRLRSIACVVILSVSAFAAEHAIDVQRSLIRIHVGKAGLFSGVAGHEHWVTAPIADGAINDGEPGGISFVVHAAALRVEPDEKLKPSDHDQVQRAMEEKVLDTAHYPDIRFRSTSVRPTGPDSWLVTGDLTLRGQTRPVSAPVQKQHTAYTGACRFKQTAFGIHPVNVVGVVKVKDELEIHFSIVPAP
jgi:YceI-like domain